MILGILSNNLKSGYSNGMNDTFSHRYAYFHKHGIEVMVLDIKDYDIGKNVFSRYKDQSNDDFLMIEREVIPDVIQTRTSKDRDWYFTALEGKINIFPNRKIVDLACDKRSTYKYMSKFQPITFLLDNVLLDDTLLDDLGNEIVIKPRTGYGGEGVSKVKISELSAYTKNFETERYIVQELCDFSGGITGIHEGNHDMRLVYVGGSLIYSKLRYNENDFRANRSTGGLGKVIDINDLPKDLLVMGNEIISSKGFSTGDSLLSLDLGFDWKSNQRKLIEINHSPGFIHTEVHEYPELLESYYKSIISMIK